MIIPEHMRLKWVSKQKLHKVPVNVTGVKIHPDDKKALSFWKQAGIDKYMKKV